MDKLFLPNQIEKHVLDMEYEQNNIGCSQASVYKFYSKTEVLKQIGIPLNNEKLGCKPLEPLNIPN